MQMQIVVGIAGKRKYLLIIMRFFLFKDLSTPTMVHESARTTLDRSNTVHRTDLRDILMDQFAVFQLGKRLHLLFHHS